MKKSVISVIAIFVILYILPLGVRPIAIPDESRYAEIPREILASGDWVVPRLAGLKYFEKPIAGYWINALSIMSLGENAFAVRLPSAISTGISAMTIFLLVSRFAGGTYAGMIGAVSLLTCILVFAVGTLNVLDSLLSMFLTAAMTSFFFAHMEKNSKKKAAYLALFGSLCGMAFLTKGFLAFAVPVVAILPFMLWERRGKDLFKIPWLPMIAAALVSLPWGLMIHLTEADFWNYFFWTEHIKRFLSPVSGQHPKPYWYFIPVIVLGAFPWISLLPAAIPGIKMTRFRDPLLRFASCWLLFPFLFFSASSGKLVTYILPCFPPIVILITVGLLRYLETGRQRGFILGVSITALTAGILGAVITATHVIHFADLRLYGESETWKWVVGISGFFVWSLLSVLALKIPGAYRKMAVFSVAPMVFLFASHFIAPDRVMEGRAPGRLLVRHSTQVLPDTILVSDDHLIHAVCWFYKRDDVNLLDNVGEHSYGLRHDDSNPPRLLSPDQFAELISRNRGRKSVIWITDTYRYKRYRNKLPAPVYEDTDRGFIFARF